MFAECKTALNYLVCPHYYGVGTIVAVVALATTLYSPILIFIALTFKVFIAEQSPQCNIT